ncbi:hypothetical protein MA16_Dca028835 [Dendrobium catenatum]|uniref:Uncharacterized protein n=1 Tax=Dendrobium catenatum TaxID=906689 RepID=A0A2I0VH59_9ASPA|nr:hypothetical protein MA16_Dca028835 [Dendrobium catenatum]
MRKLFPRRPAQADWGCDAASDGGMADTPWQPERRGRPRKGTLWHTHWFLFGLAMAAMMFVWLFSAQLNLMNALEGSIGRGVAVRSAPKRLRQFGAAVRFRPIDLLRKMEEGRHRIDRLRSTERLGIRPPRLALVRKQFP